MTVFERVRSIAAATLKVNPSAITETTRQPDVRSWDSLGHVNLMVALEAAFDIQLEPEDFSELTSIESILDYLRSRGIA